MKRFKIFKEKLEPLIVMLSLSNHVDTYESEDESRRITFYRIYTDNFTIFIQYKRWGYHKATIYFNDYRDGYNINPLDISVFTDKKLLKETTKWINDLM